MHYCFCTWGRRRGSDGENGIYNLGRELFRESRVDFGGQGSVRDVNEGSAIEIDRSFELVKELGRTTRQ